jgi:hypothetical protein
VDAVGGGIVIVEPVIGRAEVRLALRPALCDRLAPLTAGRPLVVDYYSSRLRGVATGDLIVWFGEPAPEPCDIELEPIDDIVVLAERHLVDLLESATLHEAGPSWHRHLAIALARPELWINFLERHPSRRR